MMKLRNVLLACALGAGSLLAAGAPASAARVYVGTARPAAAGRVFVGGRYYGTRYGGYGYPYRYGYGYPYRYAVGVGVGVGGGYGYVGGGYGYGAGGYGFAPYPAVYGARPYLARRPYWHPYRRAYWGRPFVR